MEFTCEKKDIQSGVSSVEKIVATRSTLPIIGNILFEANKHGLKLSANNLEIGIEIGVKAKVSKEGAILLPAKTLAGVVSKLPDSTIGFRLNENGTVRIAYKQSQFNLHALPADEFPELPKIKEVRSLTVDSELFLSLLKQVIFAVSSSEEKYVLAGVLIETGKSGLPGDSSNLRVVATDGYRLAKRGAKIGQTANNEISAIIPAKAAQEIIRICENRQPGEIKIGLAQEQISFQFEDVYLVSRLIQGKFPDYKQVIPKKSSTQITLTTKELLAAAERVAVVASGSANVTRFEVKNKTVHISAQTPDIGSIDEALEAEIKGEEKIQAAFNIRLIIDALKVISADKIVFELNEGLSPGVIKPEGEIDYLYIVMPIRTQGND